MRAFAKAVNIEASTPARVVGIIMAHEEMPLLLVSVSYALLNHVEKVLVINHSLSESSREDLSLLTEVWEDRATILDIIDENFEQAAVTNAAVDIARTLEPDWIYIFDSDEFLLTNTGAGLSEYLGTIPRRIKEIRYGFKDWISFTDFNEENLDDYLKLRFRTKYSHIEITREKLLFKRILGIRPTTLNSGSMQKILFRNEKRSTNWIAAGTHYQLKKYVKFLETDFIYGAHLSLLSWPRLQRKAKMGGRLINGGFSPEHGWHAQELYRHPDLYGYWLEHSFELGTGDTPGLLTDSIEDEKLVQSLKSTIDFLRLNIVIEGDGQVWSSRKPILVRGSVFELQRRFTDLVQKKMKFEKSYIYKILSRWHVFYTDYFS